MITRLTGTLESLDKHGAVIMPAGQTGVGFEVLLPGYLADFLLTSGGPTGLVGRLVTLCTLNYLESQNQGASFVPRLIGFGSAQERAFFELLTSVKGLGNRRGLRALAMEPGLIARAIVERDTRVLQKLPEIGPKLAESIVHELKSKAEPFVSLRARVEVGAADSSRTRAANEADRSGAAMLMVEVKEVVSPGALSEPSREDSTHARAVTKRQTKSRAASGETDKTQASAPTPPVRQTVQALIALGEQPMEAERMVARALDRAASAGELEQVLTAAGLLSAAYASR
jgi:Holliday junction DNA helicase RuvA